jgi:integrase
MSTPLRDILRSWTDWSDAAANTKIEWSSTVDLFERIIGVVPIESITTAHLIEFRNILKTLPRMRGLLGSKADYVKLGQDTPPGKRVAPATVNKRIVAIKSLLNFAEREVGCSLNVQLEKVHGLKKSRSSGRLPFTVEEVATILMHPVSVALPKMSPEVQLSTKWLLLLGAYTGARLREMAQLEISDIFTTEGVTCLAVTYESDEDDEQDGDNDRRQDKSVKSDPSIRNIPLHDDLIAAGFAEFFSRRKRKGWTYLFEDLDAYLGNRAKNSSRHLNRIIRSSGCNNRRTAFHSLRHTFRQQLEDVVDSKMLDYLAGHSPGSEGARYAHGGTVKNRKRAINRLKFSDVDWLVVANELKILTAAADE